MNKVYTRINWENYPSEKTAVNESNLNKMDSALNEIDTRVVEHETTKANVASLNELINYWHIDETTGVITIHKVSGEQIIFDLNLEKVPVGFSMTDDGILIMTTDDGTEFTANIGSMIPVLTFNDSEQIAVAVSGEGVNKTYTFTIKTGSISEDKLQPNFLADCRLYAGNAENSAVKAGEYMEQAREFAEEAEASFTELSYEDYEAKNYDPTKNYHIPDFPYTDGIASQISFDDSVAQTGTKNVQGAIESIEKSLIKNQNFGIDGMPVGKLLDGRTVYMAYGSQPITMTASESFEPYIIEHGITDIKHILSFELIMISGSTGYKLPYFTNGALHTVLTYINTESFCIDNRTSAWTDYTARYTMYYTKE